MMAQWLGHSHDPERSRAILDRRKAGDSLLTVAERFGISATNVGRIARQEQGRQNEIGEFKELPAMIKHALWRGGYTTAAQVQEAADGDLLAIRNFGQKMLAIVRQFTTSDSSQEPK